LRASPTSDGIAVRRNRGRCHLPTPKRTRRMFIRPSHGLVLLVGIFAVVPLASAGKYNQKLKIGDRAPEWKELPGVDGQKHSLSDLTNKEIVVVAFTCNSCPYAVDYEDRLIEFAREHSGPASRVALVAINVNRI